MPVLGLIGGTPCLRPFRRDDAALDVYWVVHRGLRLDDHRGGDGRVDGEGEPHGGGPAIVGQGHAQLVAGVLAVLVSRHGGVVESVLLRDVRGLLVRSDVVGCAREQHTDRIRRDRRILREDLVLGTGPEQVSAELVDETLPGRVVRGVSFLGVRHRPFSSWILPLDR